MTHFCIKVFFLVGDPTFTPATIIAPAMISPTTKSYRNEVDDWVLVRGRVRIKIRIRVRVRVRVIRVTFDVIRFNTGANVAGAKCHSSCSIIQSTRIMYYAFQTPRIQDFHLEEAQKIMCAHEHHEREVQSL